MHTNSPIHQLTITINISCIYTTTQQHWVETKDVRWEDRLQHHSKSAIGNQSVQIHYLSIINSFVLVLLLTFFLAIILMRVVSTAHVTFGCTFVCCFACFSVCYFVCCWSDDRSIHSCMPAHQITYHTTVEEGLRALHGS